MIDLQEFRDGTRRVAVTDPPLARFLFQSTGAAWIWLVVRLWVGWALFAEGQSKFAEPSRLEEASRAMGDYWGRVAAAGAESGRGVDEWQRALLQALSSSQAEHWLAGSVAVSELVLGLAILLGVLVGVASAGGIMLSLGVMTLTGSSEFTPLHAALSVMLALAWKNAGFIGFDRYVLRGLGAPWWDDCISDGGPRRRAPRSQR